MTRHRGHRRSDQPPGAQRGHRSGPRRRCRAGALPWVADEVRKLAEKTMNATKEVGQSIRNHPGRNPVQYPVHGRRGAGHRRGCRIVEDIPARFWKGSWPGPRNPLAVSRASRRLRRSNPPLSEEINRFRGRDQRDRRADVRRHCRNRAGFGRTGAPGCGAAAADCRTEGPKRTSWFYEKNARGSLKRRRVCGNRPSFKEAWRMPRRHVAP